MLDLLIFILSTIGLTLIVTQSYIFKPIRTIACKIHESLGKLLSCTMCFGFWSGMFIKTLLLLHNQETLALSIILIFGFIGSFVCYLTYLLIKGLMDKYD